MDVDSYSAHYIKELDYRTLHYLQYSHNYNYISEERPDAVLLVGAFAYRVKK